MLRHQEKRMRFQRFSQSTWIGIMLKNIMIGAFLGKSLMVWLGMSLLQTTQYGRDKTLRWESG
jgi:hypothetical protein